MKLGNDYETTTAGGQGYGLNPGGYVCKINEVAVDEDYGSPRLTISFDIAEGDQTDYYKNRFVYAVEQGWTPHWDGTYTVFRDKKDGSTNPTFKALISAVEHSNDCKLVKGGDFDEQGMKNKLVGLLFNDAPYAGRDSKTHQYKLVHKVRAMYPCSIDRIRDGDFSLPKPRELSEKDKALLKGFQEVPKTQADDDDLPF